MSSRALSAYRNILRATATAFKNDVPVLVGARKSIREGIDKGKLATDKAEIEERVKDLNDIALYLRQNIVQGVKVGEENKYRLSLNKDTELGDNDSIKKQKERDMGTLAGVKASKCCSSQ